MTSPSQDTKPIPYRPPRRARLKRELPPAAPLPALLQTLGSRWLPLPYMERCHARYGTRFTIYPVFMPPLVFLSDRQDIRAVVSAPADVLHPGAGSAILAPLIGPQAFLLAEEDEHLCARTATIPAFHNDVVRAHKARVEAIVASEIATWPANTPFAVHPLIRRLTLKAVLATIFPSEDPATIAQLDLRVLELLSITATFLLQQPRLRHLPRWRGTWRRFIQQRTHVEQLLLAIIRRRRTQPSGEQDTLGRLLTATRPEGVPMSDREVHDHIMSMIVAGHETTSAELAWSFQLLAHNPAVQERLISELNDDPESPYLTATIHETMRHRPAFLFAIPRKVVTPTELGGWQYPAGTHLVPCTYLMHHNPDLYPEPNIFRPERFVGTHPQPGSYLPWGAGHKRCIGRHFALLEMQSVLRETLTRHTIQPATASIENPRWRSAILVPQHGSRITLHPRH